MRIRVDKDVYLFEMKEGELIAVSIEDKVFRLDSEKKLQQETFEEAMLRAMPEKLKEPQTTEKRKYCPKCKTWKTLDQFHKDKYKKDGLYYRCKSCSSTAKPKPGPDRGKPVGKIGSVLLYEKIIEDIEKLTDQSSENMRKVLKKYYPNLKRNSLYNMVSIYKKRGKKLPVKTTRGFKAGPLVKLYKQLPIRETALKRIKEENCQTIQSAVQILREYYPETPYKHLEKRAGNYLDYIKKNSKAETPKEKWDLVCSILKDGKFHAFKDLMKAVMEIDPNLNEVTADTEVYHLLEKAKLKYKIEKAVLNKESFYRIGDKIINYKSPKVKFGRWLD